MADTSMIMTALGTGTKVAGDLRQSKQDSQMAEFNASVAEQNAQQVQDQATENARRSLINSNKVLGSQAASFGASGVTGGSALDVLQDTAAKGALDAMTIKAEGAQKAAAYANEYKLQRYRASNYLTAGNFAAAGDFMGGVTKVGGMATGAATGMPAGSG